MSHDKPIHTHDCAACVFIGSTIGGGRIVDCYAHETPTHLTLVARYSSEGADYTSTDYDLAHPDGHSELWAAKALYDRRVIDRGQDDPIGSG